VPQRVVAHAVAAQQFQGMQQLRTLANDVTDVLASGQMIRHSDTKHLDRGHAANVQHLWRQTFSVLALAVSEYNLRRLGPVEPQIIALRPTVYIIQFCRPGVGISSWNNNISIVSILEHQISSSDSGEICCVGYI